MRVRKLFSPLTWPVLSFALTIALGSFALWWQGCQAEKPVSYIDALFIATSAVCVTGLSTLDISAQFNSLGQSVILVLMQLGGLGVITYTSLAGLLLRHRIAFTDRLAVTQALLYNTDFRLARFLRQLVFSVLVVEALGALALYAFGPPEFTVFSSVFHAVSAFCNAGFSTFSNNLEGYSQNFFVCMLIMLLIVWGGIGFSVHHETFMAVRNRLMGKKSHPLSRHARLVYGTSFALVVGGAALILMTEWLRSGKSDAGMLLSALFQSVTTRTAGFNTVNIGGLADASLLVMLVLMFVGGSPGSCAGGIKTTTLRVLLGFMRAQFSGARQIVLLGRAVPREETGKALSLFFFSVLIIVLSCFWLTTTESAIAEHSRAPFLALLFETVSAFGTVGLSMGVTSELSATGKGIIIANMFIGRVGLFTLLAALQSVQTGAHYDYPEARLPIG